MWQLLVIVKGQRSVQQASMLKKRRAMRDIDKRDDVTGTHTIHGKKNNNTKKNKNKHNNDNNNNNNNNNSNISISI